MTVLMDSSDDREKRDRADLAQLGNGLDLDGPLDAHRFVARLMCGCTVGGETRHPRVRMGSHGWVCVEGGHGFQLFEDFISARPL